MDGRSGVMMSEQVAMFDTITDLGTADFTLPEGMAFLIKNEGTTDVTLEVIPAASELETYQPVKFSPGWNPELVRAIKTNESTLPTLKYGY